MRKLEPSDDAICMAAATMAAAMVQSHTQFAGADDRSRKAALEGYFAWAVNAVTEELNTFEK